MADKFNFYFSAIVSMRAYMYVCVYVYILEHYVT